MKTKEWLKKNRKLLKLTQKELAEKLNLSADAIRQIESGRRFGAVETWKKIEDFFERGIEFSYGCEELIEKITQDIEEFGENERCILIYKVIDNNILFINYDFIVKKELLKTELEKDAKYIETNLKYALEIFKEQNKITK